MITNIFHNTLNILHVLYNVKRLHYVNLLPLIDCLYGLHVKILVLFAKDFSDN